MAEVEARRAPRAWRRRIVGDGRVPIWLGIPFFLMGLLALAIGWGVLRDEQAFGEAGATVRGSVVDLRRTVDDDSTTYHVDYAFRVPETGSEQHGSSSVSRSVWAELRKGDLVTVTYLPADPGKHRLGSPEPQLAGPLAFMGAGALFAVVGPILVVVAIRERRRPSGAGASASDPGLAGLGGAGLAGPVLDVSQADLGRVDTFTRSWFRVFGEVVVAPVGGAALLALAIWSVPRLFESELYIGLALAGGFIGTLLLVGGIDGLRRGPSRRLLEVGPGGVWLPGLGHLAWADVTEVRLEEYHGARRRGPQVRRIDVLPDGREIDAASRSVFRRVGIVPRDPALAERANGRLMQSLTRGMSDLANSTRRDGVVTEAPDVAPFAVAAYEVRPSIEAVIASIRRFAPVVDRITVQAGEAAAPAREAAALPAPPAAPSRPSTAAEDGELSGGELRELDARLATGAASAKAPAPAPTAGGAPVLASPLSTFVAHAAPPVQPGARATRVFRRRGFGLSDAVSMLTSNREADAPPFLGVVLTTIVGIVFSVVPFFAALSIFGSDRGSPIVAAAIAAVGVGAGYATLRMARRRWSVVTGDDQLLTVGPEGLSLRGAKALPWSKVEGVTVEDGVLKVRPQPGTGPLTELPLDLFADDNDVIIDAVAAYTVVDER